MAKPSKLAHVVCVTRRFDGTVEWYKTVFGAEAGHRNLALPFFTCDDERCRQEAGNNGR